MVEGESEIENKERSVKRERKKKELKMEMEGGWKGHTNFITMST